MDTPHRLSGLSLDERARIEQRLLRRSLAPSVQPKLTDDSPRSLSFAQESLWFFDQLAPGSPLYNIPQAFRLEGPLDRRALQQAFERLTERQSALRTRVELVNGAPRQRVQEQPFDLQVVDLSALSPAKQEKEVARVLDEEARRPFNLLQDLLLRARLIVLGETRHVLTLSVHHFVSDFTSLSILYKELGILYSALVRGEPIMLPDLPLPFVDWAAAQRARVEGGALGDSLQ